MADHRDCHNIADLREVARKRLPRGVFEFVDRGTEDEVALRNNRAAFDDWSFVPHALVDVSHRSVKTTLFGREYAAPFGFAPMGGSSMAAYQGDIVLARCAAQSNIPMIMSGASLSRLEDVRAAGSTAWFQAYLPGETKPITELVERVAAAGFDTLVLTVDVPVGGCGSALGCFRVLTYEREADGRLAANGGDGWVLAVEFTDTPRAWSVLAYGESNRPDSPWYAAQAERFAKGQLKRVAFTSADVDAGAVVRYRPGAP